MTNYLPNGAVHVKDIKIWAHVGVFEEERLLGQFFSLDFSLWIDLDEAARNDDINRTADYGLAIRNIQKMSLNLECLTIEHFSEKILTCLEDLYGKVPMQVLLRKCKPPISGFNGTVAVERKRYFPS